MGALTNYYVDPSGGDDSRTTGQAQVVSTPWMTFAHAIDTITRDATNGDQINIKDSAEDTSMSDGSVNLADYGAPTQAAPLVIRGYSSAANDGGFGEFSGGVTTGNGTGNMFDLAAADDGHDMSNVHWIDMEIGKQGRNGKLFSFANDGGPHNWSFRRCKLGYNCSYIHYSNSARMSAQFSDCAFYSTTHRNQSGTSCLSFNGCASFRGVSSFSSTSLADVASGIIHVTNHIDNATGPVVSAFAIRVLGGSSRHSTVIIRNCSFYSGTADAHLLHLGQGTNLHFTNNLVEGYNGSGKSIIASEGGDTDGMFLVETGGNAGYNNTNWIDTNFHTLKSWGDDEVVPSVSQLESSPFTDAPNSDFSPVDVGNVHGGSLPTMIGGSVPLNLDKGAIQRSSSAGVGDPSERGLHPIEWGSV